MTCILTIYHLRSNYTLFYYVMNDTIPFDMDKHNVNISNNKRKSLKTKTKTIRKIANKHEYMITHNTRMHYKPSNISHIITI